jgi:hypothetical protein
LCLFRLGDSSGFAAGVGAGVEGAGVGTADESLVLSDCPSGPANFEGDSDPELGAGVESGAALEGVESTVEESLLGSSRSSSDRARSRSSMYFFRLVFRPDLRF